MSHKTTAGPVVLRLNNEPKTRVTTRRKALSPRWGVCPEKAMDGACVSGLSPIAADLVIHNLATVVLYPRPYRGKKTPVCWDIEEATGVSIAGKDGRISWIGPADHLTAEVKIDAETCLLNGHGLTAIPGFVDCHTHLVYAGNRSDEFEMRVKGCTYLEIMAAGGGILNTVESVKRCSEDDLLVIAQDRVWEMIQGGVTTLEIKSGYGLDLDNELKLLRVVQRLSKELPITIISTFMGAHAIPRKYKKDPDRFVDLLCREWIPEVARQKLAQFNDVFTENKAFNVTQSRRILEAGLHHGLKPKLHADEITRIGGIDLAVEVGATSADHLLVTETEGIQKLHGSGVIPTLLPGTSTFLMETHHARAREMIDAGLPVAIASDHNPGSCQFAAPGLIQTLAMLQLRMTASESLMAATLHAAHALDLGKVTGAIEVGRWMDLALVDAPSFRNIGYQAGKNLIHSVICKGMPIHPH